MGKKRYIFEAKVYPSGDQYEVHIPLLDSYTCGSDQTDAMYMAQDLVETLVSSMAEDGEEVPQEPIVGRRPAPDGGLTAMLFTYGDVPEEPDISVQDTADILGISPDRVRALCSTGQLESHEVGSATMVSAQSVRGLFDAEARPAQPDRVLVST